MGLDLSMFVERREGGAWVPADPPVWREASEYHEEPGAWEPADVYFRTCGRNRGLMAMLMGYPEMQSLMQRDSDFYEPPLAVERGLPPDVSPLVAARVEYIRDLVAGRSWLGLRELLDVDWSAPHTWHHAYVRREHAPLFDGVSFPAGWPDDRDLYRARWASDEAALRWWTKVGGFFAEPWRGREIAWEEVGPVYTRVRWVNDTYASQAGPCFMNEVLPRLRSYGDPDAHRVILVVW